MIVPFIVLDWVYDYTSDPRVTYSDLHLPTLTYSDLQWPTVTYSDPKVTYIDPTHLPLPLPTSPGPYWA